MSLSWASSTCVLFISLTQLVNEAKFLNITFLLVLLIAEPWAAVLGTVIVALICIYGSQ